MEELATDWRFLLVIASMAVAIGEARFKLARCLAATDSLLADKLAAATIAAEIKNMGEDLRELKLAISNFNQKYDTGTARLWSSLEAAIIDSKERLAKLEGKMNSH